MTFYTSADYILSTIKQYNVKFKIQKKKKIFDREPLD